MQDTGKPKGSKHRGMEEKEYQKKWTAHAKALYTLVQQTDNDSLRWEMKDLLDKFIALIPEASKIN